MYKQVNNAVSSLFKMGALESADKEAKVTSLGYIVSSLGLDLAVARTVVLGVILGCPVEAAVLGAAIASQVRTVHPKNQGTSSGRTQVLLILYAPHFPFSRILLSCPILLPVRTMMSMTSSNSYQK